MAKIKRTYINDYLMNVLLRVIDVHQKNFLFSVVPSLTALIDTGLIEIADKHSDEYGVTRVRVRATFKGLWLAHKKYPDIPLWSGGALKFHA